MKIYKYTFRSPLLGSIECEELFSNDDGRRELNAIDMAWLVSADDRLSTFLQKNEEDLTEYIPEDKPHLRKIVVGDYGVIEGKLHLLSHLWANEELTEAQMEEVMDYLTGQFSDGWGEGLEQREWREDTVRYETPTFDTTLGEWDEESNYATAYFYVHPWSRYNFSIALHDFGVEEVEDPQPTADEELRQTLLKIKELVDEIVEELKNVTQ